jgi:hypothetical protein
MQSEQKRKANIPQQQAQKMKSTWRKFNATQTNAGRDHKLFSFAVQIADDFFLVAITLFVSTTSKVKEHNALLQPQSQ